jgi:hypothetical protein
MRRASAAAVLAVGVVTACTGEPEPDLEIPPRAEGQVVLDLADIVDDEAVAAALAQVEGFDTVAVTYETEQANAGEARRAAQRVLREWDAELAVIAVAQPGDFTATGDDRERFVGVEPADSFAVPGSLREQIAEESLGEPATANDWTAVFTTAGELLAAGLRPTATPTPSASP